MSKSSSHSGFSAAGCGRRLAGMTQAEGRERVVAEIEAALKALVDRAARLTAEGVDTSRLSGPVAQLQEALGRLRDIEREGRGGWLDRAREIAN